MTEIELLNNDEVEHFLEYCHHLCLEQGDSLVSESELNCDSEKQRIYWFGVIAELYQKNNAQLQQLLKYRCDHDKLIQLLNLYQDRQLSSGLYEYARNHGLDPSFQKVTEPLTLWIRDTNYMLAFPLSGNGNQRDDLIFQKEPEMILTYVYLVLMQEEYERIHRESCFEQGEIRKIYAGIFRKSSTFGTWGLIPVDTCRNLFSEDDPPRIFDKQIDKTIFLQISRPLAMVLGDLYKEKYIGAMSFMGDNKSIYDGENHISFLMEAVEAGRVFSMDIDSLPEMSKLVSENYGNSLWITVGDNDITFEELCDDFDIEENDIITQMVHLQYSEKKITHIDHEYIFYSVEEYEERIRLRRKGKARKRFKTFKVDQSHIPMDYPCKMFSISEDEREDISVPFIYFVLNSYFKHKDLLTEYFQKIL